MSSEAGLGFHLDLVQLGDISILFWTCFGFSEGFLVTTLLLLINKTTLFFFSGFFSPEKNK